MAGTDGGRMIDDKSKVIILYQKLQSTFDREMTRYKDVKSDVYKDPYQDGLTVALEEMEKIWPQLEDIRPLNQDDIDGLSKG